MPAEPRGKPYIWATWLTRLLVGDNSCEWAVWFKAHYTFAKPTKDMVRWRVEHTDLLAVTRTEMEIEGGRVTSEDQNTFRLVSNTTGVTLSGKPDLVRFIGDDVLIADVKTGTPRDSDIAQVLIYMWALPASSPLYRSGNIDGRVVYKDHSVPVPSQAVTPEFKANLFSLIKRVSADEPARKVPSPRECGMCEITIEHCPERIEEGPASEQISITEF
jgi:hypothetical protein